MTKYATLDSVILGALGNTSVPIPFHQLASHSQIRQEAEAHAVRDGRDAWRVIEGRVTALRKAGKIKPAPKQAGWELE